MEKVTLIVAIYKSEKFLRKLINSIVNQTYKNLEVILVNDGSPDNSGGICDEYVEADSRVQVIHKMNGGTCEARNIGLQKATGEYISIIDGDDWLEPDYVEYLMRLIHETGSEMAMTDQIFTTRDRTQTAEDSIETWTAEEAAAAILYPRFPIGPWNKMYKTEILRKNNITFSVPWSGEGLWFSSRAAQFANHVGVGHRKIYNYRLNNIESGLTHYNLQMGINALENIKYIGEQLHIRTPKTVNAVNWHIWKNYCFQLFLIIATDSAEENRERYKDCLKNIRKRLPEVLIYSELPPKTKLKMLIRGMFPVWCARRDLDKQKKALQADTME